MAELFPIDVGGTGNYYGNFTGNFTGNLTGTASYTTTASFAISAAYAPGGGGGSGSVQYIFGSNLTQSFTNSPIWVFTHSLGVRTPIIEVYDSNYNQLIPQNIDLTSTSSATITFPVSKSGFAIASLGGVENTGSLLVTASFNDPNLTFIKGDSSSFNVNLSKLVDGGTF